MNWWMLLGALGIVLLGSLASRLGWIDLSNKNKRPGGGGSLASIGDEVFAPSRHEAAIELDRQSVLPSPAPVAGDGDRGVYDGRITITTPPDADSTSRERQALAGPGRTSADRQALGASARG